MFKNMKLGLRLGLGFALVLLLLAVIAFIGITRLATANAVASDIVNNKWMQAGLLQEGLAGVNDIGLGTRDLVLATDTQARQASKERILKDRAHIAQAWEKLQPTLNQPKSLDMMQQILDSRERFIASQNQVIKLVEDHKINEARAYVAGDFNTITVECRSRVNALIKFQGDLMDQAQKTTSEQYQQTRSLMIALFIAAFLIGAGIAFWVIRGMGRSDAALSRDRPGSTKQVVSNTENEMNPGGLAQA
jgi:methyl-accepting chemotaxis protein